MDPRMRTRRRCGAAWRPAWSTPRCWRPRRCSPAASPALLVLFAGLAMFYRVLFEGSRLAATPGKLVLGLRVSAADGARLSYATAALRGWPWWLSGAVAGIAPTVVPVAALASLAAIAAIPLGAARRGLHDRMAGTLVVAAGDHAGRDPAA